MYLKGSDALSDGASEERCTLLAVSGQSALAACTVPTDESHFGVLSLPATLDSGVVGMPIPNLTSMISLALTTHPGPPSAQLLRPPVVSPPTVKQRLAVSCKVMVDHRPAHVPEVTSTTLPTRLVAGHGAPKPTTNWLRTVTTDPSGWITWVVEAWARVTVRMLVALIAVTFITSSSTLMYMLAATPSPLTSAALRDATVSVSAMAAERCAMYVDPTMGQFATAAAACPSKLSHSTSLNCSLATHVQPVDPSSQVAAFMLMQRLLLW
mmetsp:Transcript_37818/g.100494  ORF Transcript_37818/g.100494 Transcript_37818/m.100494 type:complete len:267 (+) Transcript_37818:6033-6833(+)